MAKLKYDNTGVEDVEARPAPVGTYRATLRSAEAKKSNNGNSMIECVFDLTHDASGTKLKESFDPLWYYPILDHDHPFVRARFKEFVTAVGLPTKGTIDTDKIVGAKVLLKLGSDTDQDGDYRPKVKKVMALASAEDEPEEPEEDEEEQDEEESVDLDSLSRAELKQLIKDEELEIRVLKSMSDDDLREKIAEALGEDEEEPEDEDEEEDEEQDEPEDEEEGDDYEGMSLADLKAELKDRELSTSGSKKILIARLRKDDKEDPV